MILHKRMKQSFVVFIILLLAVTMGCGKGGKASKEDDLLHSKSMNTNGKKSILIVVDSLMYQAIDEGIRQNKLPTFQYLIEHGQYYKNLVSSFPTMSLTIDSSIVTGTYPDGHRVPGLTWYSSVDKKVINYGTGPMEIVRHNINTVLNDALIQLNGRHLNPKIPTIHEDLAKMGLTSGSVNGLIYRGNKEHTLSIPPWIQVPTDLPKEIKVKGPDFFAFGAFSNPLKGITKLPTGLTDRMGLNNKYAVGVTKQLIHTGKLPDFLYVYLPDLDQRLHKKGPADLDGVIKADRQLEDMLQAFGSREEALKQANLIIIGDSGMTAILPADQQPVIDLLPYLRDYRVLRPGETVSEQKDLALAVNENMAYMYKLNPAYALADVASLLKTESRIDTISWLDNGSVRVVQGGTGKEFSFRPQGKWTDPYGQSWTLDKDASVLDLNIDSSSHRLQYGQYPDVMRRLHAALHSHEGEFLVITAKPGYELADRSSPTHKGGGGHGSFHQSDSLVPLIICGTEQKPEHLRIVDLKPFLLKLSKKQ